jgi:hypothetical protein
MPARRHWVQQHIFLAEDILGFKVLHLAGCHFSFFILRGAILNLAGCHTLSCGMPFFILRDAIFHLAGCHSSSYGMPFFILRDAILHLAGCHLSFFVLRDANLDLAGCHFSFFILRNAVFYYLSGCHSSSCGMPLFGQKKQKRQNSDIQAYAGKILIFANLCRIQGWEHGIFRGVGEYKSLNFSSQLGQSSLRSQIISSAPCGLLLAVESI